MAPAIASRRRSPGLQLPIQREHGSSSMPRSMHRPSTSGCGLNRRQALFHTAGRTPRWPRKLRCSLPPILSASRMMNACSTCPTKYRRGSAVSSALPKLSVPQIATGSLDVSVFVYTGSRAIHWKAETSPRSSNPCLMTIPWRFSTRPMP